MARGRLKRIELQLQMDWIYLYKRSFRRNDLNDGIQRNHRNTRDCKTPSCSYCPCGVVIFAVGRTSGVSQLGIGIASEAKDNLQCDNYTKVYGTIIQLTFC